MHVAISGWRLGEPSGANRRLLEVAAHAATELAADERITVLHRPDFAPPQLHPRIAWHAIAMPLARGLRRAMAERRLLGRALTECGANVLDHAMLPLPRVPVPACLLLHDLREVDGLTRWPRWLARWVVRDGCRRATTVIVPSAFSAARLRAIAPAAKIAVVPNGVVLPDRPARATLSAGSAGYLLHVGHLERRKNVAVLLRALALLPADERPELQLVGRDAGEATALRQLATELQLDTTVHFRGVLPDTTIAELTADARAIVVPSHYEGFGLAALDGLAYGRPTLVAAAGALPEVVGDAATILPPDDAAAWARAIAATAVDPLAAAAGRRRRAARFAWSSTAAAMLAIWRAALSAPMS